MITRRLFGLGLLAAPVVIRTPGLLMNIRPQPSYLVRLLDEYGEMYPPSCTLDYDGLWLTSRWLMEQMHRALLDTLEAGPIRYNTDGLEIVQSALHRALS